MTPDTTITFTLLQLISLISSVGGSAIFVFLIYWRLNSKIQANAREIKAIEKAICKDMENRFEKLALETKNTTESHNTEIRNFGVILSEAVRNLTEQTKSMQVLTKSFGEHLIYHKTVKELKKQS